jgi:hypothetical protein
MIARLALLPAYARPALGRGTRGRASIEATYFYCLSNDRADSMPCRRPPIEIPCPWLSGLTQPQVQ